MRRPSIGITTSRGRGRFMWWFYWLSMHLSRAKPVRLTAPADTNLFETFDGFIIGGGNDIAAEVYQGESELDVRVDPERDKMEMQVLEYCLMRDIPILGICRGAQMLNVFLGGSLHQDIRSIYSDVPDLWTPLPRKGVEFVPGTELHRIFNRDALRVNSMHHQAVDQLGEGLIISARDEFGIVQAIEHPVGRFRAGVQWHPEFMIHQASQRRLFRAFIAAVERRIAEREVKNFSG